MDLLAHPLARGLTQMIPRRKQVHPSQQVGKRTKDHLAKLALHDNCDPLLLLTWLVTLVESGFLITDTLKESHCQLASTL
jgi:hypothetical protein